jgi:AraC-like DNA-binding protein
MILWVRTGTAHVEFEDHEPVLLTSGEAIWLPQEQNRRVRTETGTVAFPLFLPRKNTPRKDTGRTPKSFRRFEIPPERQEQQIAHFSHMISAHAPDENSRSEALQLLDPATGDHRPHSSETTGEKPSWPPIPSSTEALAVAQQLMIDPGDPATVGDWAKFAACSEWTLRRQFLQDTGLTFAKWRSQCRLSAASELLAAGHTVHEAATHVGFTDRTGFSRAFHAHHGLPPREFAHRARTTANDSTPMRIHAHSHGYHLLVWLYRGSGEVTIDGTTSSRTAGDAFWIPAGAVHSYVTTPGSISLAVATVRRDELTLEEPVTVTFPPEWDDYLLWHTVSTHTKLRPTHQDSRPLLDAFHEQFTRDRTRVIGVPRDHQARALAEQFLDTMRNDLSSAVPSHVLEVFRYETGMTFPRWQHTARMRRARDLLDSGTTITSAARQLGYAHLSNFSRAFSRHHGLSPRAYQRAGAMPS